MKNAWDWLSSIRQRLAAGERLVEFALSLTPGSTGGRLNLAEDENQVVYDLGDDFIAVLLECRTLGISYSITNLPTNQSIAFGPGLRPFWSLGGTGERLNLFDPEDLARLRDMLPEQDPDDDDWWRH